jgi:AbrB family looped-hinge helix DNA binding protein
MTVQMVRVQEKGQVTIPLEIRQKLRLKKGDMVTFVETDKGVMIVPVEVVASQALKQIGQALKARGLDIDQLMERGRDIREGLIEDEYNLPASPTS